MISIYMDQHIPRAITEGLRLRGVEVITAYDFKFRQDLPDEQDYLLFS